MTQPGVTDWIDVSVTVRHGMPHWPDNRPIVLKAGIWIIESLGLSPVSAARYEMICLPVKLHGGNGAPAWAILRPTGGPGTGRATPAGTAR